MHFDFNRIERAGSGRLQIGRSPSSSARISPKKPELLAQLQVHLRTANRRRQFMPSEAQSTPTSKAGLWTGRILSALPVCLFLTTGMFVLLKPAAALQGAAHFGFPDGVLLRVTIVEIACAILYAIPRTAVLGAILLTGYLGGAVATHVRVGEPFFFPLIVGVIVWAGLYLRDTRVRALIPLRKPRP
jgi:hypothetical protein